MILFFGDVHSDVRHVLPAVLKYRPAAVIFLGDIQAEKPLEQVLAAILPLTEVWFIHGNHDSDSQQDYQHLFESDLAGRNLHGRVVEIAGVRVAGLGGVFRAEVWMPHTEPRHDSYEDYAQFIELNRGGVFRAEVWMPHTEPRHDSYEDYAQFIELNRRIRPVNNDVALANRVAAGKLLRHRSTIFPQEYNSLSLNNADVLVTHEAPSCHVHGFAAIDELAQALQVQKAFHGHHHDSLDYQRHWLRLGFQAFGVGLRGVMDLNGQLIRAGELDAARNG